MSRRAASESSDMQMSDLDSERNNGERGVDSDIEDAMLGDNNRDTPAIYSDEEGEEYGASSPPAVQSSPARRSSRAQTTPRSTRRSRAEYPSSDVDEDAAEEEELEEEQPGDGFEDEEHEETTTAPATGLKIKLKLHGPTAAKASTSPPKRDNGKQSWGGASTSTSRPAAPIRSNTSASTSAAPEDFAVPARGKGRRAVGRVIQSDEEVESEDEYQSDAAASAAPSVGTSSRHLTARQAVLASVVDSTHVSLIPEPSTKKKHLTETEAALRKEETARKRKNMSEKKLEDEKAETINRLLKKKTKPTPGRARGKPGPKPKLKPSTSASARSSVIPPDQDNRDMDVDRQGDENDQMDVDDNNTPLGGEAQEEAAAAEIVPWMYRWVSSSRQVDEKTEMTMTFSIPLSSSSIPKAVATPAVLGKTVPSCDYPGCEVTRKYRLVKDWEKGACGMAHLNALKAQAVRR